MKSFDFAKSSQEMLAQVQAAGQQVLDASQKTFAAQMALAQENTQAAFGLCRAALTVGDVESAKSFFTDAARATREAFERSVGVLQETASLNTQVAQDLGKQASRKR